MLIKENQSILIPVDFSKQSLVAIKQAYNLAKFTHSKIILMHSSPDDSSTSHKSELEGLAVSTRAESGLMVDTLSRKGDVYELTDQIAEELKSSLIVIGLDTHARFRKFGINNVSKFIKKAPCPVLTIRSIENKNGCKNIVIPLDLNPDSREKVPIAIQMAHYYKADIRIVSVFDPADDKYEDELLPYLLQVKKFIKNKGVNCSNKSIASEHVAETIVEYANKNECDLIIQMNKTDWSFGDMFKPASAEKLVDISNIPVLSINPRHRESNASFGAVGG